MLNPEKFIYDRLGVKKEYPETNLAALSLLIGISNLYVLLRGLQVKGFIPAQGPVILIANHTDITDAFSMFYAGVHARDENGQPSIGRVPRGVGKSTLFGIAESLKMKERTGKKDLLNSNHPLVNALIRTFIGGPLSGAGVIPVRRGTADRVALREINRTLQVYRQPVALSIMETRVKSGRIQTLRTGAAFVIKTNPEVPFCPVGISQNPNAINIGQSSTYSQLKEERGELGLEELTLVVADEIAKLLRSSIQNFWIDEDREREYRNLIL